MHRRSTLSRLSAVLLGAALLLTLAAPAEADRWSGRDAAGDVEEWSYSLEPPPCGTYGQELRPDDAEHDITRLVVVHRRTTVEVTVHLRELRRTTGLSVELGLRTPGRGFQISLVQRRTGAVPLARLFTETEFGEPGDCGVLIGFGEGVDCRRLEPHFSAREDTATVTVPRRCLGNPRGVRAAASLISLGGKRMATDEWAAPGTDTELFPGPFGPRVRRG